MFGQRAADQLEKGGVVGHEGDGWRDRDAAAACVIAAGADVGEESRHGREGEGVGEEFSGDHVVGLFV